jgi:diguanylate cyclase (GGDEF)-like protein/PAS domain S-box-containing protein
MSAFEAVKMAFFPSIHIWPSHGMTILFASGFAGVAVLIMLVKHEQINHRVGSVEARYRLLFECSPTGAYLISSDGRILDCNLSFCRIFGYSKREELIGRSIDRLFPSAAEQSFYFSLLKKGEALENVEHCLQRRDQTEIWVLHSAVRVSHEDAPREPAVRGTMIDITENRRAEFKEHQLAAIVRCTDYAVLALSPDGIIETWNGGAERIFGYSAQEMVGRSISIIAPPVSSDEYVTILEEVRGGTEVEVETIRKRKDGKLLDVALSANPIRDRNGNQIGVAAILRDIRDRKRAERALLQSAAQYRLLFEKNPVPMWVFDRNNLRFLAVNKAAIQQYGFTADQFLNMTIAEIRPEASVTALLRAHEKRTMGLHRSGEWQHRTHDGSILDVEIVSHTLEFEGHDAELVAAYDITERNRAEEQIQLLAFFDPLTQLPNRTLLRDRLDNALATARRRNEKIAVLHLDLDHFKAINDTLGHASGDALLKEVAERLRACVRNPDTVARTEGDGFLIILNGIADLPDAGSAARRIKEAVGTSCELDRQQITISSSIGIAVYPDHSSTPDLLIKNAESAMYSAKEEGRNAIRFFTSEINGRALELFALEREMRSALEQNQFFLVYQPQIDIGSSRIVGLEALLRWRHPELGLVPPDRFIPIAERNGLIHAIGEWVLRTACIQMRSWQSQGLPMVPVAVNVSAVQFRSDGFGAQVCEILAETGLAPDLLELELTETMLFSNVAAVHECVRDLQAAGIKIAIDDFGTGYSSLGYLKQFRVNKLKIDRSFIRDIPGDHDDEVITQAIIGMARSLKLTVIAEGVETDAQMSFLKDHGCDQIQGYWYSRPASPEEIASKLISDICQPLNSVPYSCGPALRNVFADQGRNYG